jgi:hypothetical protein
MRIGPHISRYPSGRIRVRLGLCVDVPPRVCYVFPAGVGWIWSDCVRFVAGYLTTRRAVNLSYLTTSVLPDVG